MPFGVTSECLQSFIAVVMDGANRRLLYNSAKGSLHEWIGVRFHGHDSAMSWHLKQKRLAWTFR